jgi:hypothetical protein
VSSVLIWLPSASLADGHGVRHPRPVPAWGETAASFLVRTARLRPSVNSTRLDDVEVPPGQAFSLPEDRLQETYGRRIPAQRGPETGASSIRVTRPLVPSAV